MKDVKTRASGARIIELEGKGDVVVKLGEPGTPVGERINAQTKWLLSHENETYVADVIAYWDGACIMPKYDPLPYEWEPTDTTADLVAKTLHALSADVWCWAPMYAGGPTPLAAKWETCEANLSFDVQCQALDLYSQIDWREVRRCHTHGNPTISNCMYAFWSPRLIDPTPATPEVPDIRAVDLGRLLQSALGWETIIGAYDGLGLTVSHSDEAWKPIASVCDNLNEWYATIFCCVLHVAALKSYVDSDKGLLAEEMIARGALHLRSEWDAVRES